MTDDEVPNLTGGPTKHGIIAALEWLGAVWRKYLAAAVIAWAVARAIWPDDPSTAWFCAAFSILIDRLYAERRSRKRNTPPKPK